TRREDALTKDPLRFGLLLAGVSIPASAVTAVFIWYLTPLLLSAEGLRPADIARVVMLYYLAAILVGPLASELSERTGRDTAPVLAGLLIAAISLLSLAAWSGDRALTAAVLGVGIGHALMRAPLLDLAIAYAGGSVKAIGLVRMAERLGAMAGLGAAALLVTGRGGWNLPAILGIVTVAGGMLFAVSSAVVFYRERYNHEGR
ncbi:MAG: MFS transporter, partial [Gammaproteobacteria bacterium]